MKYGGERRNAYHDGYVAQLHMEKEYAPRRWRKGVVVNIFKNGDKADPARYRGIMLLSTVGKTILLNFERYNGNNDGKGRQKKRRASKV